MERIMTSPIREAQPSARSLLDIRICRVINGNGNVATYPSVPCPRRERSVSMDDCAVCPDNGGLHLDPVDRTTSMVCKWNEPDLDAAPDQVETRRANPLTPVASIMARDVVCVGPNLSVEELIMLFLDRSISGAPVVDERGTPIGVISETDLIRATREEDDTDEVDMTPIAPWQGPEAELQAGYHVHSRRRTTARELMTPVVLTVHESANIGQAASMMAYEGVHRLPVVSDEGRVVGLLSTLDILRWYGRQNGYLIPVRPGRRISERPAEANGDA